jgi:hypothetical protein
MNSVLPTSLYAFPKLGWVTIFSVIGLVGGAAVLGLNFVALSGGVPAGGTMHGGEKTDLLDAGYGPYFSGSTERDAPSAVRTLTPNRSLAGLQP